MFDVGFSELVLLFVIGLLILGPERLPRVAAQLGRWVGRARRTATQLRLQFEREMTMQDILKQQRKPPNDQAKKGETKTEKSTAAPADAASAEPAPDAHADADDTRHRPGPDASDSHAKAGENPVREPAEHTDESR